MKKKKMRISGRAARWCVRADEAFLARPMMKVERRAKMKSMKK
jgi:hypothetical protein